MASSSDIAFSLFQAQINKLTDFALLMCLIRASILHTIALLKFTRSGVYGKLRCVCGVRMATVLRLCVERVSVSGCDQDCLMI